MMRIVILLLLLFSCVTCTPRSFLSEEMCRNTRYNDCSFQIINRKNDICKILNTAECEKFDFTSWTKVPVKVPFTQNDLSYHFEVYPYAGLYSKVQYFPVSSINVTFNFSPKDINGFLLLLSDSSSHHNICRIFDLRNVSSTGKDQFLFYDCLSNLVHSEEQNFSLTIRSLPNNYEVKYKIFIPDAESIEPQGICSWKPLVMIFNGGFQDNVVELKFSQAPLHLNVSQYKVSVVSKTDKNHIAQTAYVESKPQGQLLDTVFSFVDRGYYDLTILPIPSFGLSECEQMKTWSFFIEKKLIGKTTIVLISAIAITSIILVIVSLLLLRWLFKPVPITRKPHVVLVFSYDCKEHENVVLAFWKYLENHCLMTVSSIYDSGNENPDQYLKDKFAKCDIVLLIISKGVFHKIEEFNIPPMDEGHKFGDRYTPSHIYFESELLNIIDPARKKKFIKILFEYTGNDLIPKSLHDAIWGETFKIPTEMNRFLCHAHNQHSKITCMKIYPLMPGHDVLAMPSSISLINNIENMKNFISESTESYNSVEKHRHKSRKKEKSLPRNCHKSNQNSQVDNAIFPTMHTDGNIDDFYSQYDISPGEHYEYNVLDPILSSKIEEVQ